MKQLIAILVFLLALPVVSADLSDYPDQFITNGRFDGQIIVGLNGAPTDVLAATEIAVALKQQVTGDIPAETDDLFNPARDAIIIGLPCTNTALAEILDTTSCSIGLDDGEGYVKLINEDATYLIVTGSDAEATRKAGRYIALNGLDSINTDEIRITGSLETPTKYETTSLVIEAPECSESNDCDSGFICQDGECKELECPEGYEIEGHGCVEIETAETKTVTQPPTPPATPTEEINEPEVEELQLPETEEKEGFFSAIVNFFRNLF